MVQYIYIVIGGKYMKRRTLCLFISFMFVFTLIFNSSAALASSKTTAVPKLKMITQPLAEYHPGERVSFIVSSPNYGGTVQYRVILYNGTTKKTSELWPGYPGYYYTKWQPSGSYNFKINWPVQGMEPGAYSLTVLVRRAGAKVPYDSYVNTNAFTIKNNSGTNTTDNTNTTPQSSDKTLDVKEIAKKNTSVFLLKCYDKNNNLMGTGSGFLVSQDGKIVTNFHVVEGASQIKAVSYDEKEYNVEGVLNYSIEQDIAVLSVKGVNNLPCLTLGDSDKLELGENIVAIGSPLGLQNTVSTGIVSSFRKNIIRSAKGTKDIQISAPISHGSSGGPLFNASGEVVGITYAGYTGEGQNLNFAIPVNEAKSLLQTSNFKTLSQLLLIIPNPIEEIEKMQNCNFYADYYTYVSRLGNDMSELATYLSVYAKCIVDGENPITADVTEKMNSVIDFYNKLKGEIPEGIASAKKENIDISDINSILSAFNDSISHYKAAFEAIKKYGDSKSNSDIASFMSNIKAASNLGLDAMSSCDDGYMKIIDHVTSLSSTNNDVNIVKFYCAISECYKVFNTLGYSIGVIDNYVYLSHIFPEQSISSEYIDNIKEGISTLADANNGSLPKIKEVVATTKDIGIDISDTITIQSDYAKALDYYKTALDELINYKSSKLAECIQKIEDNSDKGYDLIDAANKLTIKGYDKYSNLVENYLEE